VDVFSWVMLRRRRTLSLLATPAVIAALAVAVPALAGTSLLPHAGPPGADAPGAHRAAAKVSATKTRAAQVSPTKHCFTVVLSRGHHELECLIPGPRGARGARGARGQMGLPGLSGSKGERGATGKAGSAGKAGTEGQQGSPGAPGTARAYAVVQPISASAASFVAAQTVNFTAVAEIDPGVYCLTPAAGIAPESDAAAVSPEVSYSIGGAPGVIAANAKRTHGCPGGTFEVDTFAPTGATAPGLASGYAFTIVVP